MGGGYDLSLFCLRGSRTNRTLIRATGEDHFLLIILTQLKLFVSKIWASKNCWGQFFRCVCSHRFFSSPLCGPKNAVNFLDHDGPKKGCNPWPSAGAFSFVRCEAMSKVQKRYSLPKSNRNSR